jgi:hypothetical protein
LKVPLLRNAPGGDARNLLDDKQTEKAQMPVTHIDNLPVIPCPWLASKEPPGDSRYYARLRAAGLRLSLGVY